MRSLPDLLLFPENKECMNFASYECRYMSARKWAPVAHGNSDNLLKYIFRETTNTLSTGNLNFTMSSSVYLSFELECNSTK